mmetsp:Transcript_35670/g.53167  ORF Transcript_35670/g.53167 Transcript_35670/m.53167 type:complete len:218 (-) Transcript_35670:109-762(-)
MIIQSLYTTLTILLLRTLYILHSIHSSTIKPNSKRRTKPVKTLAVLGSGGHTTELLTLLTPLNPINYTPLICIVASTDTTSLSRWKASGKRQPDGIHIIPRSREVGQSYVTSVVTTLYSFGVALWKVGKIRPDLVLCNGPGTCLPIVVVTFVLRVLGLCEGKVVFVESFCRVNSLSLTGKLLYPIVDRFLVHWEELYQDYPRSELISTFIQHGKKRD